jgi:hypothetical protein
MVYVSSSIWDDAWQLRKKITFDARGIFALAVDGWVTGIRLVVIGVPPDDALQEVLTPPQIRDVLLRATVRGRSCQTKRSSASTRDRHFAARGQ